MNTTIFFGQMAVTLAVFAVVAAGLSLVLESAASGCAPSRGARVTLGLAYLLDRVGTICAGGAVACIAIAFYRVLNY